MNDNSSGQYRQTYLPEDRQTYQYVSDYQDNSYAPKQSNFPGVPFAQSQAGQDGLYTVSNQTSHYTPGHAGQRLSSGSRVRTQSNQLVSSQVKNEQVVKGQSRINYVPYEKKVIEYENRSYVQRIPKKKKMIRYQERREVEMVPHEVTKTDYYTVEKRVEYQKQIVPEKRIEMVQVERKVKRYEYVPVEKQIVHYPENIDIETAKGQSRMVLGQQGIDIRSNAQYKPINPTLLYSYSNKPENRDNHIGYVDQGASRVLSTAPTYLQNQTYMQQPTQYTYTTNNTNNYNYQPFQNIEQPPQTLVRQSSPGLVVTNPRGGVEERTAPVSRGSYITELSSFNQPMPEKKRPFEHLQKSRNRPGITQVKRKSSANNFDYYGQTGGRNERDVYPRNSQYDWKVEK